MNTPNKHDPLDDAVIFSCKGISLVLAGIAGVCTLVVLYGFFKHLFSLAVG